MKEQLAKSDSLFYYLFYNIEYFDIKYEGSDLKG